MCKRHSTASETDTQKRRETISQQGLSSHSTGTWNSHNREVKHTQQGSETHTHQGHYTRVTLLGRGTPDTTEALLYTLDTQRGNDGHETCNRDMTHLKHDEDVTHN